MSVQLLEQGKFEDVNDRFVINYEPITNIVGFNTFTDETVGEIPTVKFFKKDFAYSINGAAYQGYFDLTNTNLQAIPVNSPSDILNLRIRYTRKGSDDTGIIKWDKIVLENIEVNACIILRYNWQNWIDVYGSNSKNLEISQYITEFNVWAANKFQIQVFIINDSNIPDLKMFLEINENAICDEDLNIFLRKLWGNYFVDGMFNIEIDLYDGDRS